MLCKNWYLLSVKEAMATKLVSFAAVGERCVTSQKTAAKETTTKQDLGLAFSGSFQKFRRALPYMAVPSGVLFVQTLFMVPLVPCVCKSAFFHI